MDVEALGALGVSAAADPEASRTGFALRGDLPAGRLVDVAAAYKAEGYILEAVTAVDREEFREVWYQFNRHGKPDRHCFRVEVDPATESLPTLTPVYGAANWFERDAWDMLGVAFEGHPNLKRLLLPEDADFHPLRRDQCLDDEWTAKRAKQRAKRAAAAAKAAAAAAAPKAEAPKKPVDEAEMETRRAEALAKARAAKAARAAERAAAGEAPKKKASDMTPEEKAQLIADAKAKKAAAKAAKEAAARAADGEGT